MPRRDGKPPLGANRVAGHATGVSATATTPGREPPPHRPLGAHMATTTAKQSDRQDRRESSDKDRYPMADMIEHFRDYARDKPEAAALWCLGIGFVLGWKLKPW